MARLVLWLTQGRFERFHSKEDSWLKRKLSLFSLINTLFSTTLVNMQIVELRNNAKVIKLLIYRACATCVFTSEMNNPDSEIRYQSFLFVLASTTGVGC